MFIILKMFMMEIFQVQPNIIFCPDPVVFSKILSDLHSSLGTLDIWTDGKEQQLQRQNQPRFSPLTYITWPSTNRVTRKHNGAGLSYTFESLLCDTLCDLGQGTLLGSHS